MATTSNNYSLRRVGMLITDITVANRSKFLMQIAVMVAIFVVSTLFFSNILLQEYCEDFRNYPDSNCYDPTLAPLSMMFYCYSILFMALSASNFNKWMSTKAKRLSTLMVPATRAEKFTACFAVYILFFMIILGLTVEMCDLMRVGYAHAAFPEAESVRTILPEVLSDGTPDPNPIVGWAILAVGIDAVIFMLGSMIWPRNSFLYTCVALLVLGIFTLICLNAVSSLMFENGYFYPRLDNLKNTHVAAVGAWIIIVFCTAVSYLRFRDDEITKRW